MRAYATDRKERVVRAVAAGQPMREAARRFGVAVTTVTRAVVHQRATGSLERKPRPGRPRAISRDQEAALRARLEAAPDATLQEHCAWGGQSSLASHSAQPRCGEPSAGGAGRRQKSPGSRAVRDAEARQAWREAAAQVDPEPVVFGDASGTNSALTRRSGGAPHDQRATGSGPRTHGKNTTLVAALTPDGRQVPWLLEGAMDAATCVLVIREQLGPTLRPGQVVVRDQLRVHKAESMRHALDAGHCQLLFLPPSSPDFTSIEQAFSTIKAILRGLGARTHEALWEAVRVAVAAIMPDDALAWFAHAGHALPAQSNCKLL